MPPSSLPSLLFIPKRSLKSFNPSIHCKTFQTARKLPKWEKEINCNHQHNKSASHVIPKTLSPRIWLWHAGEMPKPESAESALPK